MKDPRSDHIDHGSDRVGDIAVVVILLIIVGELVFITTRIL